MKNLVLPLVAVAALAAPAALAEESSTTPRIAVTGEGETAIAPDTALITLAVTQEAETARAALDENNEAMDAVIEAMKEEGIAERDLQTAGLAINPRYVHPDGSGEEERSRIVGYEVTNTVAVRVRELDGVGEIIDRAVTLGVNQGGNIAFTNDDPSDALDEARRKAVEDAMAKARTLAEAAGVELGDVIELSEQASPSPPRPMQARAMRMEAADASVPVEAGENTYRVEVKATFALDD